MNFGTLIDWASGAEVLVFAALSLLAVAEQTKFIRLARTWRHKDEKIALSLDFNARLNEALAMVATSLLILWVLTDSVIAGIEKLLVWSRAWNPLFLVWWYCLFFYVFLGVVVRFANWAVPQVQELLEGSMAAFQSLRTEQAAEKEAELTYSYRRQHKWRP